MTASTGRSCGSLRQVLVQDLPGVHHGDQHRGRARQGSVVAALALADPGAVAVDAVRRDEHHRSARHRFQPQRRIASGLLGRGILDTRLAPVQVPVRERDRQHHADPAGEECCDQGLRGWFGGLRLVCRDPVAAPDPGLPGRREGREGERLRIGRAVAAGYALAAQPAQPATDGELVLGHATIVPAPAPAPRAGRPNRVGA